MTASLQFFYDYGSTYSYLANSQLPALHERTGSSSSPPGPYCEPTAGVEGSPKM